MATERTCLVRGPSDSEERCAPTLRGNTKVMMCFCQGDLCNVGPTFYISSLLLVLPPVLSFIFRWCLHRHSIFVTFIRIVILKLYLFSAYIQLDLILNPAKMRVHVFKHYVHLRTILINLLIKSRKFVKCHITRFKFQLHIHSYFYCFMFNPKSLNSWTVS